MAETIRPTLAASKMAAIQQTLDKQKTDDVNSVEVLSGPHPIPDCDLNLYAVATYDDFEGVWEG